MSVGDWAIATWAVSGSLLWIVLNLRAWRALTQLPALSDGADPERDAWPRVTLVVPACNEQATIEAAAETWLALDYPELEIVIVDDRSTDETGAMVDALAARDPRVRALHVTQLPDGWLGKVHALARGVEEATGEWILLCDADVHLAPSALRCAVALAQDAALDHLPVLPHMVSDGFWLEAAMCCFGAAYLATLRVHRLLDPSSDAYAGVGAFNLVRADMLRRSEGLAWLRLEIADDVGVGLLVKRAGGRTAIALGGGLVRVRWYESVAAMTDGLDKNMFAVFGRFSVLFASARIAAMWAIVGAPVVALAAPLGLGRWPLVGASVVSVAIVGVAMARRLGQRVAPAIVQPLTFPLLTYMVARSTWRCRRRGGVIWRGQLYSIATLREGQRVKV